MKNIESLPLGRGAIHLCAFLSVLASGGALASAQPAAPVIPATDAARIFARAHALCGADAGRLWGASLCVPIVLVDPKTHQAISNVPVAGSIPDGSLFRFVLPADAQISTAPAEYGGVHFAELIWPLPGSADAQAVSLMHESFHIIQPKLGFSGYAGESSISGDPQLDTQAGRVWLRGELHALRAALRATGPARKRALQDALALRLYRDSLFAETAELERQQDIMEGLAEATGIDAGLPASRRIPYVLSDIALVEGQPSYARSFPYATGPAYSELLDAAKPGWRLAVTPASDIAQLAPAAYGSSATTPGSSRAQEIIARYDGVAIESQEAARAAHKAAMDIHYTQELVTGPTITLELRHFSITFNPRDIETFGQYGSLYHTVTVNAPFGSIAVSGGDAIISKDFHSMTLGAPPEVSGSVVRGTGWTLTLAAGNTLVPDPKKAGSYIVSSPPQSPQASPAASGQP